MSLINFAGLASGIDSNALIDATTSASKAQRVTPKEDKITELTDTNDTLSELKDKLRVLQSKLREFATINNGGVAKTATSADETILTATASSAANNGSYTIIASQLAKNATYSFKSTAGTYTSTDAAVASGMAGSDTVQVVIGTSTEQQTVNVTVNNTTTLSQFVTSFNNSTSKATASIVDVGTSVAHDYRVVINSNYEGELKGELAVTVGSAITTASAFNNNTLSAAQNAQFKVTGIGAGDGDTIERFSNSFSDVIPGVTITLQNTSTSGVKVVVGDDAATTASKIQEWVDAYNEIVTLINEKDAVTRTSNSSGAENIFGPLANTQVDEGMLFSLRSNIASAVYSSGTKVRILADLGITTERDGTLKFDTDTLETAVADEPSSVRSLLERFADTVSLTTGTIEQYVRFNGLIDVTVNGNNELITNLNDQIERANASIDKEAELLRQRFARLESLIGTLQNQQSSLTSALAGLNG